MSAIPEAVLRRLEGGQGDYQAEVELVLDEYRELVRLGRRLVELNPAHRSKEWWEAIDELARHVS